MSFEHFQVPHAVALAHEAIKMGKCVVIGLQSTGEARTLEQLERDDGELSDFVSTAKGTILEKFVSLFNIILLKFHVLGVFQTLVEKHFPAPDRNRIQRLLGLEPPTNSKKPPANGNSEGSNGSSKRKPSKLKFFVMSKKNGTGINSEYISVIFSVTT